MLSRFLSKPSTHLRFLNLISTVHSPSHNHLHRPLSSFQNPKPFNYFNSHFRSFSSNGNNDDKKSPQLWNLSEGNEDSVESIFGIEEEENNSNVNVWNPESRNLSGNAQNWNLENEEKSVFDEDIEAKESMRGNIWRNEGEEGIFKGEEKLWGVNKGEGEEEDIFKGVEEGVVGEEWGGGEGEKVWNLGEDGKEEEVFDLGADEVSALDMSGLGGESESKEMVAEKEQLEEKEKALTEILKGKCLYVYFRT